MNTSSRAALRLSSKNNTNSITSSICCDSQSSISSRSFSFSPTSLLSSSVKTIEPQEVLSSLNKGENLLIVDVRPWEEFSTNEHLKSSVNLPLNTLEQNCKLLAEAAKDKPVFTLCRSGMRSAKAAEILGSLGISNVVSINGGMNKTLAVITKENNNSNYTSHLEIKPKGQSNVWEIERQVRATAGSLVVMGTLLSVLFGPVYMAIPAFVGSGLVFSAVTNTCGMAAVLMKMPWNRTKVKCDINPSINK